MTHAQLCQETYQVVDLVVLCEERQLVPLLVLDECLDVHVEGFAGGTVRGLGSQLTLSRGVVSCLWDGGGGGTA